MLTLNNKLSNKTTGFKGVGNLLINKVKEPWNILKGNISLPAATLQKSTLDHNQLWMQKFSEKFGFQLAPHGKTTMQPELFKLQMDSGCWGVTLATAYQVGVAFSCGVKRVIMANQLVGHCNMDIISSLLTADPNFEFTCLVDSASNVEQLGKHFSSRNQKIQVLLEYGLLGGRTGVRNDLQEKAVVAELQKWRDTIQLVGIEFFEGILKEEDEIRKFISWTLSRIQGLVNSNVFYSNEVIISGAGTAWFDVVADEFRKFERLSSVPIKKILRSGCYLIYDIGLYKKVEERVLKMDLGREQDYAILSESLKPALKIWAYVHSVPEQNLAIIGLGKRDVAMDCGYPIPHHHYRPGSSTTCGNANESWQVFNMMDQHTYLRIGENDNIEVGDIISFDIYHPCTTMDKWRNVLMVDDDFNVIDVLHSDF